MSNDKSLDQILAEMSQRVENATEGPWEVSHIKGSDWYCIDSDSHSVCSRMDNPSPDYQQLNNLESNFNFIAHARTDVPALIACLKRAIEQREYWMRQLDGDEAHMQFSIGEDNAELAEILKGKV